MRSRIYFSAWICSLSQAHQPFAKPCHLCWISWKKSITFSSNLTYTAKMFERIDLRHSWLLDQHTQLGLVLDETPPWAQTLKHVCMHPEQYKYDIEQTITIPKIPLHYYTQVSVVWTASQKPRSATLTSARGFLLFGAGLAGSGGVYTTLQPATTSQPWRDVAVIRGPMMLTPLLLLSLAVCPILCSSIMDRIDIPSQFDDRPRCLDGSQYAYGLRKVRFCNHIATNMRSDRHLFTRFHTNCRAMDLEDSGGYFTCRAAPGVQRRKSAWVEEGLT